MNKSEKDYIDNAYEQAIEELKKVNDKLFYDDLQSLVGNYLKKNDMQNKEIKSSLDGIGINISELSETFGNILQEIIMERLKPLEEKICILNQDSKNGYVQILKKIKENEEKQMEIFKLQCNEYSNLNSEVTIRFDTLDNITSKIPKIVDESISASAILAKKTLENKVDNLQVIVFNEYNKRLKEFEERQDELILRIVCQTEQKLLARIENLIISEKLHYKVLLWIMIILLTGIIAFGVFHYTTH